MSILVALVLAASPGAAAEEKPGSRGSELPVLRLSMEDAVRMALASSERVRSAELEIEKAKGRIEEARSAALPRLDMGVGFSRYSGTGGLYPPQFAMGLPDYSSIYQTDLTVSQLVYQGGQVQAGLRAARVAERQAARSHRLALVGVTCAARTACAGVLLQQAFLDAAREAVELAERHLKDVRARKTAGTATEFEELQALVQLKNAEAAQFRARTAAQDARDRLLRLVGLDQGRELVITESLAELGPKKELLPLGEYLAHAKSSRLELKLAEDMRELRGIALEVSTASRRPTISVQFAYAATSDEPYFSEGYEFDWRFGLQFRWTLFDGLQAAGKRAQARAELDQAELERQGLLRDIEYEVRSAYWRARTARELVESQSENVRQALEAVRQAELRYREGLVTELVEKEARLGLTQARTNLAQALFEQFAASVELERASGLVEPPSPTPPR